MNKEQHIFSLTIEYTQKDPISLAPRYIAVKLTYKILICKLLENVVDFAVNL